MFERSDPAISQGRFARVSGAVRLLALVGALALAALASSIFAPPPPD